MTQDQQTTLHNFEAKVRLLMMAYRDERAKSDALRAELLACQQERDKAQAESQRLKQEYELLRTARIIDVSGSDVKDAKQLLAKLIREIDKSIALLDV